MAKNKNRINPHKHFILGKNCPDCASKEGENDIHTEHIHSYLHEPDEKDETKAKLMVFRSFSEANEYVSEMFPEYADEIFVIPLSEATFGTDTENPDWGNDDDIEIS